MFGLLFLLGALNAATLTIDMKSISYGPKVIEIKVGDAIEWKNVSYTAHSATSEAEGAFDTGEVEPKKTSKKIVFAKPGRFEYHCRVHGKSMSGTVVVTP